MLEGGGQPGEKPGNTGGGPACVTCNANNVPVAVTPSRYWRWGNFTVGSQRVVRRASCGGSVALQTTNCLNCRKGRRRRVRWKPTGSQPTFTRRVSAQSVSPVVRGCPRRHRIPPGLLPSSAQCKREYPPSWPANCPLGSILITATTNRLSIPYAQGVTEPSNRNCGSSSVHLYVRQRLHGGVNPPRQGLSIWSMSRTAAVCRLSAGSLRYYNQHEQRPVMRQPLNARW